MGSATEKTIPKDDYMDFYLTVMVKQSGKAGCGKRNGALYLYSTITQIFISPTHARLRRRN